MENLPFLDEYQTLLTHLPFGLIVHAPNSQIVFANTEAVKFFDLPSEQLLGKTAADPIWDFYDEQQQPLDPKDFPVNRVLTTRQPLSNLILGYRNPTRNTFTWALVNAFPQFDALQQLKSVVVTAIDITDRMQAEQALRQSELRFRTLFDTMLEGASILSFDWRYLYQNQTAKSQYPGHEQGVSGQLFDHVWPDSIKTTAFYAALQRCLRERIPCQLEDKLSFSNGMSRWFNISLQPIPEGVFILSIDISARKEAEQKNQFYTAQLVAALNSITDAIFMLDAQGQFIRCNPACAKFHRFTEKNECGKSLNNYFSFLDIYTPDHQAIAAEDWIIHRALQGENISNAEYILRHKHSGESWQASYSAVPFYDERGVLSGIVVLARDITQQKQAELSLSTNEERLRLVLEVSNDGVWDWDLASGLAYLSPRYYQIIGYQAEDVTPNYAFFQQLVHPDDWQQVSETKSAHLSGNTAESVFEHRIITKQGQVKWMLSRGKVVKRDAQGNPLRMLGTLRDINERKLAEAALKESEQSFATIFHANPGAIAISRLRDGQLLAVNKAFTLLYGYNDAEIVGKTTTELQFWHSHNRAEMIEEVVKQNRPYTLEIQSRHKSGEIFDLFATFQQINLKGELCLITIMLDITERKKIERELQFRNALLSTQLDVSIEGILIADADNIVVNYNQRFVDMWSVPPELMQKSQKPIRQHLLKQLLNPQTIIFRLQCISEDKDSKNRDELLLTDGRIFEWYSSPMIGSDNHYFGRVHFFRDFTRRKQADAERHRLQLQLQQAQKMESIGRLAGGIAHDFNNILQIITCYTELALLQAGQDDSLKEYLEQIYRAANRSSDITRQLLTFASRQVINPKVLDVNASVVSTLKFLRHLIDVDIELAWQPGEAVGHVLLDPAQLDQILINLCINARDALSPGGKIIIETQLVKLSIDDALLNPGIKPGDFVLLTVSDNGCGLEPAMLDKVFDPFFTTKAIGQGTGLGLAIVYGIVEQNHGCIKVASTLGVGSTFKIYLPSHPAVMEELIATAALSSPLGQGETILVVEDDPDILQLTQHILTQHNYQVITATMPSTALLLAKTHHDEIALLLTDVMMPEMNGYELAAQISALSPKIKCLFMSGYTADTFKVVPLNPDTFIQKPFTSQELIEHISKLLT